METLFAGRKPLIGVVHLPALPGAPRYAGSMATVLATVEHDAGALAQAGFDAVIVENFGDVPFFRAAVPSETVAAMTVCADLARRVSGLPVGVNVLRNDGLAAVSVAVAAQARFVRINVLVSARLADQGVIEGDAARVQRLRFALGAHALGVVADVDVKHSVPLGNLSVGDEALEAHERALADVVIVSGTRTGQAADRGAIGAVRASCGAPVWLGSGVRSESVASWLTVADGVIVGSALRVGGRAGGAIDVALASAFVTAARG